MAPKIQSASRDQECGIRGESLFTDVSAVQPFRDELQNLIDNKGLTQDQIFTLLGGTCFTSWVNLSKTQFYSSFTSVLRVR